jgi:DNA-binding response OmpR family regulator
MPEILTVDHNYRNLELLHRLLGRQGYPTRTACDLEQFDRALAEPEGIALALVDVAGFDRRIWERCRALRGQRIPFLVFSPQRSTAIQREGLAHGAHGVLVKPLTVRNLLDVIDGLLPETSGLEEASA